MPCRALSRHVTLPGDRTRAEASPGQRERRRARREAVSRTAQHSAAKAVRETDLHVNDRHLRLKVTPPLFVLPESQRTIVIGTRLANILSCRRGKNSRARIWAHTVNPPGVATRSCDDPHPGLNQHQPTPTGGEHNDPRPTDPPRRASRRSRRLSDNPSWTRQPAEAASTVRRMADQEARERRPRPRPRAARRDPQADGWQPLAELIRLEGNLISA